MQWPWLTYSCSSCPEDSCSSSPLHSDSWTLSGASFVIRSGKCFSFFIEIYATHIYSKLQINQESTVSFTSIQPTQGAQTEYTRHQESDKKSFKYLCDLTLNKGNGTLTKTLSQYFQGNRENSQTAVPLSRLSLMSCKSFQISWYYRVVMRLAKSYWVQQRNKKNKPWYILHKTSRTSGWTSCSSRWCSQCHCLGCDGASCNLQILLNMEAWDCWWHVPAKLIPFSFLSLDICCHFIDCFLSVLLVNVLD